MIVRKTLDRHKRRRRLVLLLEEYHRHPALVTGVGAIGGGGRGSPHHGRRHAQEGSTIGCAALFIGVGAVDGGSRGSSCPPGRHRAEEGAGATRTVRGGGRE